MPLIECPKCHKEGSLVHVRKTHFGICLHCKIGWLHGENLFTVSEEVWNAADANLQYLKDNFTHYDIEE
jgi:Zn-finger nucleic acid-binding protein